MDRNTFRQTLYEKAAFNCAKLIKIEDFFRRHVADNFANLQAEIDDVNPPPVGPPAKRSRTFYNSAAKAFFGASLAAWSAPLADRKHLAKELLATAKSEANLADLASADWNIDTVKTAMDNVAKRAKQAVAQPTV